MIGDADDMVARLRLVLPRGWFANTAPLLDALLAGLGTCWSAVYLLIQNVKSQARLASASGSYLDLAAADFFGSGLVRRVGEGDASFFVRIKQELLRPRSNRLAMGLILAELTGRDPVVFEPARATDTGGYSVGGVGYGVAGGWGNLHLPYQVFIRAFRPQGGGIAQYAGYGSGGVPAYGNLSMVNTVVSDADIYAAAASVLPVATQAWVSIEG